MRNIFRMRQFQRFVGVLDATLGLDDGAGLVKPGLYGGAGPSALHPRPGPETWRF